MMYAKYTSRRTLCLRPSSQNSGPKGVPLTSSGTSASVNEMRLPKLQSIVPSRLVGLVMCLQTSDWIPLLEEPSREPPQCILPCHLDGQQDPRLSQKGAC